MQSRRISTKRTDDYQSWDAKDAKVQEAVADTLVVLTPRPRRPRKVDKAPLDRAAANVHGKHDEVAALPETLEVRRPICAVQRVVADGAGRLSVTAAGLRRLCGVSADQSNRRALGVGLVLVFEEGGREP